VFWSPGGSIVTSIESAPTIVIESVAADIQTSAVLSGSSTQTETTSALLTANAVLTGRLSNDEIANASISSSSTLTGITGTQRLGAFSPVGIVFQSYSNFAPRAADESAAAELPAQATATFEGATTIESVADVSISATLTADVESIFESQDSWWNESW